MARSSFGGGGDYSSLFGSLYAQSKALKDAQQDAADKDAYDRWKNGLMSDDEWLAYIGARVDATKGDKDPGNHQRWIQLQRQYVVSIADSQAEYAYSEGKSSIHELIGYYQNRLSRLQEDSEEYREMRGHLSDLIDKRDSEDLSTGAQDISARIDRGLATYEDLLKFYRDRLGGLRPGSELHKQVTSEIVKVKGTIADTKMAGEFERLKYLYESKKISGKTYAAKLTAMAAPFKESDPQRYYQILSAANRVRQAGGSGGGGGKGAFSKKEKALEDQFRGVDNYLELFADAYKAGARVIPDPARPGQQIVLTPELMAEIDDRRLGNFDKLAALYKANGMNYKYTAVLEKKTDYIVKFVQPHNTVESSQQWGQLVGAALKTIEAGADNPDPEQSLKGVVKAFTTMQNWLKGEVVGKDGKLLPSEDQPTGDFVTNSSDFVAQALALLSDTEMDSASRMSALDDLAKSLDTDSGANYDKGTQSAMRNLLTRAGAVASASYDLATGKKVLAVTPGAGITLVDTRIQHTLAPDPETGQMMNVDLVVPDIQTQNGERIQEVWIDRGGVPTKVYAIAGPAPSGYQVWVDASTGKGIVSSVIGKQYAGMPWEVAVATGKVTRADAFEAAGKPLNYIQIPAYDDNGTHHAAVTWYQDPQTKLWYKGQPPISSAAKNLDGTVKLGADGNPAVNWMPFANAAGVRTPYAGSNVRAMQKLYDEGAVGTDPRFNQPSGFRDFAGNFTTDPAQSVDGGAPYYDYYDEATRARANFYDTPRPDDRLDQKADIDAAKKAFAAKQAGVKQPFAAPDTSFEDQIASIAGNLGISGMAGRGAAKGISEGIPGPSAATMAARQGALAKLQAVPKVGLAGATDDFAPPRMPTPISSGPALANLPSGGNAAKIDLSKVMPLPEPKPKATSSTTVKLPDLSKTTIDSGRYEGKVVPL